MTPASDAGRPTGNFRLVLLCAAGYVSLGGLLSILGWALDVRSLTDWDNTGVSIQPNAAVAALASGAALLALAFARRRLATALGIVVAVIGASALFQHVSGLSLYALNTVLHFGRDWGDKGVLSLGRMGPPGATSWTLIGVAIVCASRPAASRMRRLVAPAALIALGVASLSLIGYLYRVGPLYSVPSLTIIAFQTATFVLAAGIGLIASVPDHGPAARLREDTTTGMLMRRLLPVIIVLPIVVGLVRMSGERAGMYDSAFGSAAHTLVEVALLIVLLWWTLRTISIHEAALRRSQRQIAETLESTTDGFVTLDRDWRFTFVNAEAERLVGRPRALLLGRSVWELFPRSVGGAAHAELLRAAAARTTTAFEEFVANQNRWFSCKAYPTPDGGMAVYFQDVTQRKQTEHALAAKERQLQHVTDTAAVMVMQCSRDLRYVYVNRTCAEFLGRPVDEIIGRPIVDVIGEPALAAIRPYVEQVLSGERVEYEAEIPYSGVGARWMRVAYVPDSDGDSGIRGWIAAVMDISERKRAELAKARLAAIVESSDDAIISKDLRGVITSWNRGAANLFGYTAEEAIGQSITMLIPPDHLDEEPRILARIARGESIAHFETIRRRKDGELLDISITVSPVVDDGGTVVGASKIARDVTQRKRTERALQASRERLAADLAAMTRLQALSTRQAGSRDVNALLGDILAAAADFTQTDKGNIQLYDPANGTLRIAVHQGLGQSLVEHFAGHGWLASSEAPATELERVIVPNVTELESLAGTRELEIVLGDGIRAIQSTPLVSRDGRLLGLLNNYFRAPGRPSEHQLRMMDILARQAADLIERNDAEVQREQLLESERAARSEAEKAGMLKDEFLATLSHELRTPLNGVLGWAQLLKRTHTGDEPLREGIDAILMSARAQAQLINDLLDMNRIMSGKLALDIQKIDLASVIEAALDTVRPSSDAKDIVIEQSLDPAAEPIRGDPVRLQQVIWNLLSNAVKFTPAGGKVLVSVERSDTHVELSVSDTGIGIKPEFLPHVFERFRQAEASPSRRYGGLGLGLAIAKQIVELHGGSIAVFSEGPGSGATFRVRLPALEAWHPPESRHATPSDGQFGEAQLSGKRVLVVDDDPGACELIRRLLVECDAIVETAASGPEALARISHAPPDALLCDIAMPGMDGFEVIRNVRKHDAHLPAIALTAFARPEDRQRAIQAGFSVHLAKPVDSGALLAVLGKLLQTTVDA